MSKDNLHSLILAYNFRVDDVERMWKWLKKHRSGLVSIGAHGQIVEKIELHGPSPEEYVGRVVVDGVSASMTKIHDGPERVNRRRIRKIWIYRALDAGREMMISQEAENETSARQWIHHSDAAAKWMSNAGLGVYPTHFVGKLALSNMHRTAQLTVP